MGVHGGDLDGVGGVLEKEDVDVLVGRDAEQVHQVEHVTSARGRRSGGRRGQQIRERADSRGCGGAVTAARAGRQRFGKIDRSVVKLGLA